MLIGRQRNTQVQIASRNISEIYVESTQGKFGSIQYQFGI